MTEHRRGRWRPPVALLAVLLSTVGPLVAAQVGGRAVGTPVDTVAVGLAAYLAGAWLRPAVAAAACLGGAVALTSANQLVDSGRYSYANDLFFFAVLMGGAALAGALITGRRSQVRALDRLTALRAEQHAVEVHAVQLEERNRLETAVTERVMQRMGALVVHASGARLDVVPERALDSARWMEHAGRAILDDLRETVGSLRSPVPAERDEGVVPRVGGRVLGWRDVLAAGSGAPLAIEAVTSAAAHGPALGNIVAGLAVGAPLLVRRQRPLAATTAMVAVGLVMTALLTPLDQTVSLLLPMSLAAYSIGCSAHRWRRVAGVGVLVAGAAALAVASPAAHSGDGIVPTSVWLGVAVASGVVAAQHEARAGRLRQLLDLTERGRGNELRLAVAEQRQAVARDLHDSVAHAMTVVCLHAEAVQRRSAEPAVVDSSLTTIESAARAAMHDLRRGLHELEDDGEDLEREILDFAALLGMRPDLDLRSSLQPPERLVVRRVVREALVNVSRHAPGARVRARVSADPERLVVDVSNDAGRRERYERGSGTGLIGLSELLDDNGGRLEYGPQGGDGFRVTAYLPRTRTPVPR